MHDVAKVCRRGPSRHYVRGMKRRRSRFGAVSEPQHPGEASHASISPQRQDAVNAEQSSKPDDANANTVRATPKPASFRFRARSRCSLVAKRLRPARNSSQAVGRSFEDVRSDTNTESDESDHGLTGGGLPHPKRSRLKSTGCGPLGGDGVQMKNPATAAPPAAKDVDPLDAFMENINAEALSAAKPALKEGIANRSEAIMGLDDDAGNAEARITFEDGDSRSFLDRNKKKRPVYERIDHSKITYAPFEKCLYREVPELARMTIQEVRAARRALGSVRIRGKRCPRPIASFGQCGLSSTVLDVIRNANYEKPTPIQAQAIPCIMSGRDVIGVAKTGSGKTLAFLLPVLRHVSLQERPKAGDGPIALLIVPTRELAIQIYGEARRFTRTSNLRCVCAYGGSGVKDQISDLKRGADIVVCTPGRMIDLLAMNSGRITNLRRVTIAVLDEADRMFDMGFEPQLTRLVENVRPDRQTVMFSATFPPQVERLARMILTQPVEIVIGGNSVAANTIDQHIEVRTEDSKFRRLLQLLGVWYEKGSSLVFVDRQDNADRIFRDLSQAGYLCIPLHGGMDQADRDSALADFKNGDVKVLVATSVAARGLDVKHLTLVINFDVPNHYEDYVHRVGRTGRAGKAGTSYTFITPDQGMFAGDMMKALEQSARASAMKSGVPKDDVKVESDQAAFDAVPVELRQLASDFRAEQDAKRKAGHVVHGSNSGYGGRGFTFEEGENDVKGNLRVSQAKRLLKETGVVEAEDDADGDGDQDDDDNIKVVQRSKLANVEESKPVASNVAVEAGKTAGDLDCMIAAAEEKARQEAKRDGLDEASTAARVVLAKTNVKLSARAHASRIPAPSNHGVPSSSTPEGGLALSAAAAAAAALSVRLSNGNASDPISSSNVGSSGIANVPGGGASSDTNGEFEAELEINDYPQHARWRVTHANALEDVTENTGCVATTRGNFYPVGRNPPAGERKLHLLIEGPDERSVRSAYKEIRRKLEEAAAARPEDRGPSYSKYSVV